MRAHPTAIGEYAPGSGEIATATNAQLSRRAEELVAEIAHLKSLVVAFDRWHDDMIYLTARTRDMNSKGEDLATIARHMIMVSINAAIEAASAGEVARGFVVVAAEVKAQAKQMTALSGDMSKELRKSELMTATTFQDIQAGGKMMMAAISGLELKVRQLRQEIL